MKRRTVTDFDQLLLTNTVERNSSKFESALECCRHAANPPSIVITREPTAFRSHWIILDGNHRAVASAFLKRPVRVFECNGEADIDRILEIESRGGLAPFPHRRFLKGDLSLLDLRREAIWNAGFQVGFRSAQYVADGFLLDYAKEQGSPRASEFSVAISHQTLFIKDDIERWTALLRERFIQRDPHRVFTCSVRQMAEICFEPEEQGKKVAQTLFENGILEPAPSLHTSRFELEKCTAWRFRKSK